MSRQIKNKKQNSSGSSSKDISKVGQMKTLLDVSRQIAVFEVLDDMLTAVVDMATKEKLEEYFTFYNRRLYSFYKQG